jgi:hypothetical protein
MHKFVNHLVHAIADKVVGLAHTYGSVMRAFMTRPAIISADDQFALAALRDLPDRQWKVGPPPRC